MKSFLIIALAVLGIVWLGQGAGLIGGSFMTGEPVWAAIGATMLIAAGVLIASARRKR